MLISGDISFARYESLIAQIGVVAPSELTAGDNPLVYLPGTKVVIDGVEVEFRANLGVIVNGEPLGPGGRFSIHPQDGVEIIENNSCFGPQVMIDMWPLDAEFTPDPNNLHKVFDQDAVRAKVWKKPIWLMEVGDWVVSFDKNENLVPGPVTRTMTNDVKILLDFFGTEVTPGHVYYRPDSKLPEKFETLIDVLRDDGIVQKQDGSHVRAATNVPVGDPLDGFVHTITRIRTANGTVEVKQRGRIRLGTRFIVRNGKERKSYSIADLISAGGGVVGDDELIRVGDGEPMEFHWEFSDTLPQPEDFVLACSGTTLEDIYAASEWEQMKPRLLAPTSRISPDNADLGSTLVHIDFPNKLA